MERKPHPRALLRLLQSAVQRSRRPLAALCVLGMACSTSAVLAQGQDAEAIDPFYERLFQDGTLALSTGDAEGAIKQFELGCFGMLELPNRLADCLTRLAVARASLEDSEGFLDTLSRILEIERRFGGYSAAKVPARIRRDFESRVEQWAPPATLAGLAAFGPIADRQNAARLEQLPLEERRAQLDILIAQAPAKTLWRRLEIDLELEAQNYPRAAELVEQLTARGENLRCAGGRARAGLGSCDDATISDLEQCEGPEESRAAVALLSCHIARTDREAGESVVASMAETQREQTAVRRLIRKLRKIDRAQPTTTPAAPEQVESPQAEAASEAREEVGASSLETSSSAGPQPSQEERAQLERSRRALLTDQRGDFDAIYQSVTTLAQRHASWSEAQLLAAELAYRLSLWQESVTYFERAEAAKQLGPDQEFYLAVALYKSGQQAAAEERLERCLPSIRPSDFVQFWSARIRGES